MQKFKIFYSWQSDLPGSKTRYFIRECIDDAIAFAEESEAIEAERDEATKDTTGSPNIVTTLFSKIDECDLFIADVSLCFTGNEKKEQDGKEIVRRSPNPNVLLELGYAVKTLGWERVICLCNTDFGSDYPFDISQNRRTSYELEGKDKSVVRRKVAKIICSNIQSLKGQLPRAKAGVATHIIGTYDFKQKKVTGVLAALDITKSESYILHNEELLAESKDLLTEIQSITETMLAAKAEEEKKDTEARVADVTDIPLPVLDKLHVQKDVIHAFAESRKASESQAVWKDKKQDRERIKKWLDAEVDEGFFDLGGLKKGVHLINMNGPTYNGTKEEMAKFEKLEALSYRLFQLEVRTQYLKTFDGMCFIPLAIQNISSVADTDIRVVVTVETGEIINPDEHLIWEEYEGLQGILCRDDEDEKEIGIIAELFLLLKDGVIHIEEENRYPKMPKTPILTPYGLQQPSKTEEDYKAELKEFIASSEGRGYYEFDVEKLRPGECRWFGAGMLLKPVDEQVVVSYQIYSAHSSGGLNGRLEMQHASYL